MHLLFDVDTGVDDALALILALRTPGIEMAGIGTVAGNVDVAQATSNTLQVLEVAGRPGVPVAAGCAEPLAQAHRDARDVHGGDGLGGASRAPASGPTGEHAVDQIVRLARLHAGDLTLVAVGPLTNVATALQREPSLATAFRQVIVMGGAFRHPGNVTSHAEFNISVDPEAAKIVFEAGLPLTIVPLDATTQVLLDDSHLAQLGDGDVPRFVRAITHDYMEWGRRNRGRRSSAMHDPLATAIALDAAIIAESAEVPVTVETKGDWSRGMTLADFRHPAQARTFDGRARIVLGPATGRFFELLLPALRGS